jgi:ribosomal protein L3 glutamine methyltransferase
MQADQPERLFLTIRDWLRYAVSRFNAAGLSYGHGTSTAIDEAAHLILHALRLPVDQLDPWLDARTLPSEGRAIKDIIEKRITSRIPASYLTRQAWIAGHSFYVDERVIVPRSYLGELLSERLAGIVADPDAISHVLDLCTGSACLAVLAAFAFPRAAIDASDVSADALDVAARNVGDYGLADRISVLQSDLFAELLGRRYDLILANPPYVSDAAIQAFPPEYAAEPVLAHAGGVDGLDLVRRVISDAEAYLVPDGVMVVEVGTGRPYIEAEYPDIPFLWLDSAESEGEVFAIGAADLPRH